MLKPKILAIYPGNLNEPQSTGIALMQRDGSFTTLGLDTRGAPLEALPLTVNNVLAQFLTAQRSGLVGLNGKTELDFETAVVADGPNALFWLAIVQLAAKVPIGFVPVFADVLTDLLTPGEPPSDDWKYTSGAQAGQTMEDAFFLAFRLAWDASPAANQPRNAADWTEPLMATVVLGHWMQRALEGPGVPSEFTSPSAERLRQGRAQAEMLVAAQAAGRFQGRT